MDEESRTEELSGVGTKGASSEGFDSRESIIYQQWPAVQRSAVAYRMTLFFQVAPGCFPPQTHFVSGLTRFRKDTD